MQVHQVPALGGALWLRDGWRLFKRQPIGLPAMVVFFLLMIFVPLLLPKYVDGAVLMLVLPFATVGLMTACREIVLGRAPTVIVFAVAFREPGARNRLLRLGLINVLLALVLATLSSLFGIDALRVDATTETPRALTDVNWTALLVRLLVLAPIAAVMWFSPMLVAWHGMTPGKAMFGSAVACVRNVGSLFVYCNSVVLFVFFVNFVVLGVVGLVTSSQSVQSMFIAPVGLVVMSIVQASFYAMYASIFSQDA
jgi:hypothetical protein